MARYATMMVDRTHPIAMMGGVIRGPGSTRARVYSHRVVLYESIGPGEHACHWCGIVVGWDKSDGVAALVPDHVDSEQTNNSPDNLVPACYGCNTMRSRKYRPAIANDDLFVIDKQGARTRADWVTCEVCETKFLASIARIKRGTVSLCSRACSGRRGSASRWTVK